MEQSGELREFLRELGRLFQFAITSRIIVGGLYLAAILLFAWKFSAMERAFYQTTIRYEIPFDSETRDLTEQIGKALQQEASSQRRGVENIPIDDSTYLSNVSAVNWNDVVDAGTNAITFNTWVTADIAVKGSDANTTQHLAEFQTKIEFLQYKFAGERKFSGRLLYPDEPKFTFKPVVDARVTVDGPQTQANAAFSTDQIAKMQSAIVSRAIFGQIRKVTGNEYAVSIVMPREVARRMDQFLQAEAGYTSDLSGNWDRMVYLSATTITTLGLGDIVPITPDARWWVTIEAITGAVLIGLFLNALAKSAGTSQPERHQMSSTISARNP
jgi:hypothetical protein